MLTMSEINSEEIDHYLPQHPLPEAIRKMERDETICRYSKCSKISHTFLFLFSDKMLVIRAGIHKCL